MAKVKIKKPLVKKFNPVKTEKKKYNYTKKTGRPQKTLKDLPKNWKEIVIELSAQGKAECQIRAALCGINISLWYALEKREKEFAETLKKAKYLCKAWWIDQGQQGLTTVGFQTGLWSMNMKNRFGWSDKQDYRVSGDISIKYGHRK